jgi:BirA family transcriptional regulator, biotin operon repressor / biotin---[acetyl-CoA-carboxylase] ligase
MDSLPDLKKRLNAVLQTRYVGRPTLLYEEIGSTQDEARRLAGAGASSGSVIWAMAQTAGRGRLDRSWLSNHGAGLWFSVILRPDGDAGASAILSLAAGVAVARALQVPSAGEVRLKWPNDVLLRGRKVAGVLAEAETQGGRLTFLILGVGLNLDPGPAGFPPSIAASAASLAEVLPAPPDIPALMASLLAELESAIEIAVEDPSALRQAWMQLSDTIGREVRAQLGTGAVEGLAVDLDLDGSLVVEKDDGTRRHVQSGEVIHLRPVSPREG